YHITAPSEDGDGAFRVMRFALDSAGVTPDAVDYINAHGTSTPQGDQLETLAIKRCFGDHARRLAVSSTKSMTGHLLGAAGGLEAGITALAGYNQCAPPTVNLGHPDENCDLDYIPHRCRGMKIDYALSNSFGFGRTNAAVLFKRFDALERKDRKERKEYVVPIHESRSALRPSRPVRSRRPWRPTPMKIAVCIKQVPTREWQPRLNDDKTWIREADASFEMNEPDAYALEEALRLKEKHSGEVVVCSAGPARVAQVIREALARGADRAIHVEDDGLASADAFVTSAALAGAMTDEKFDLALTGLQSDDQGFAQVGVIMAEFLGLPHATIIMEVQAEGSSLHVKRELEGGWFQWVAMPLPAVLTI